MAVAAGAVIMSVALFKVMSVTIELDKVMRTVSARVKGSTVKVMAELNKQVRALGATTSWTAVQVGELMGKLAQAGRSAPEIKAMTEDILNLSRAAGVSTSEGADAATIAMSNWSIEADQAAHVSDVLAYSVNNSNQTLLDLSEALAKVGPTAADMGVSLEETTAMLSQMADFGLKGSIAGTGIRAAMIMTAKKGEEVAASLGVSATDASGNMRSLASFMNDFTVKTAKMGSLERLKLWNEAFGKIGLNASTVLGKAGKSVRGFQAELLTLTDYSKDAAAEMEKGIWGAMEKLKSVFTELMLVIGTEAAPTIIVFSNILREMFSNIAQWANKVGNIGSKLVIATTGMIAAALGLLGSAGLGIVLASILSAAAAVVSTFLLIVPLVTTLAGILAPLAIAHPIIASIAGLFLSMNADLRGMVGYVKQLIPDFRKLLDIGKEFEENLSVAINALKIGEWELAFAHLGDALRLAFHDAFEEIGTGFRKIRADLNAIWEHKAMKATRNIAGGFQMLGDIAVTVGKYVYDSGRGKQFRDPGRASTFSDLDDRIQMMGADGQERGQGKSAADLEKDRKKSADQKRQDIKDEMAERREIMDARGKMHAFMLQEAEDDKFFKEYDQFEAALAKKAELEAIDAAARGEERAKQEEAAAKVLKSITNGKVGSFDAAKTQSLFNKKLNDNASKQLAETKRAADSLQRLEEIAEKKTSTTSGFAWSE